jgi:chemotaxis protein MotB
LEAETTRLLSEQEALNLALAQARSEIDAGAEEARLAAARREAMEALVADLEARSESDAARISALEAAQLLDAAAAEALRERLANADTELTAMTLALEEKRREAEETLTLLAAAQSAQDGLDVELAAAVAALRLANEQRDAARQEVADLDQRLAAIALLNEASDADLQAARDLVAAGEQAMDALRAEIAVLTSERDALLANTSDQDRIGAELRAQLAAALQGQADRTTERDQQAELLAIARQNLSEQEQISTEAQREVALLNEQIAALRQQIGTLQSLLDIAAESDTEAQVQIAELGAQLNVALARAAAEERRRRTLEEAERARLEEEAARLAAEAQNLERFRSDFFGQLRDVVEGEDGVRIEGDRFVFSSEVLFRPGQAELSVEGQAEIAKVADILRRISADIPDGIDWVIRVDGHTDNVPLSGRGAFANNWELSQARARSVVLYMSGSLGIAPERLAANGFGQYQPLDPADTPEARAQNRRIELKLTER